jgi:geranylgeranyl pyrophosphate synthase
MSKDSARDSPDFSSINWRGKEVNEEYGRELLSGVRDPSTFSIFSDIKSTWKDGFRVTLTSLACEAVGGDPENTYPVSVILSLIGSGIGIHDDIIDESSLKRFGRTIPGIYGADKALVLGDILIVKGFTKIRNLLNQGFDKEKLSAVLETYEEGFLEMCEGEMMDISYRKNIDIKLEDLHTMLWKLGIDLETCSKIGAIVGGGDINTVNMLGLYGKRLGFINRLYDEVKDTLNLEGNLVNRLKYESIPLPILYTAQRSPEHYSKVKTIVMKDVFTKKDVDELLDLCYRENAFGYIERLVTCTTAETINGIEGLIFKAPKYQLSLLSTWLESEIKKILEEWR